MRVLVLLLLASLAVLCFSQPQDGKTKPPPGDDQDNQGEDMYSPDMSSPDMSSPDMSSPDMSSPEKDDKPRTKGDKNEGESPDMSSPDMSSPDMSDGEESPDMSSPDMSSPDMSSPEKEEKPDKPDKPKKGGEDDGDGDSPPQDKGNVCEGLKGGACKKRAACVWQPPAKKGSKGTCVSIQAAEEAKEEDDAPELTPKQKKLVNQHKNACKKLKKAKCEAHKTLKCKWDANDGCVATGCMSNQCPDETPFGEMTCNFKTGKSKGNCYAGECELASKKTKAGAQAKKNNKKNLTPLCSKLPAFEAKVANNPKLGKKRAKCAKKKDGTTMWKCQM